MAPVGARLVLDHDALPERGLRLSASCRATKVGGAAGRKGDDQPDRTVRIILRRRAAGRQGGRQRGRDK